MRGAWRRAAVAAGMVTVMTGCGGGGGGEDFKLSEGEASEEFTQDIVSSSFECHQEAG